MLNMADEHMLHCNIRRCAGVVLCCTALYDVVLVPVLARARPVLVPVLVLVLVLMRMLAITACSLLLQNSACVCTRAHLALRSIARCCGFCAETTALGMRTSPTRGDCDRSPEYFERRAHHIASRSPPDQGAHGKAGRSLAHGR
jgi:hypothetical protein